MKKLAPLLVCALALTTAPGSEAAEPPWNDASRLVFFAVLEGLYTEGVDPDAVEAVIGAPDAPDAERFARHFVYACPLCHPTYEAFKLYQKREPIYGLKNGADTFGPGLDPMLQTQLESPDRTVRMEALHTMIQGWVEARLTLMRLDEDERHRITAEIEAARDEGMRMLETARKRAGHDPTWTRCAICDGAFGACRIEDGDRDRRP